MGGGGGGPPPPPPPTPCTLPLDPPLHVEPTAIPVFHEARPVPYALREEIEQDLERLERAGTIEPVQYSEWATPIVPVMKSDDTVRV